MRDGKVIIGKVEQADIDELCEIAVQAWQGIHDGYREQINNDDLYGRVAADWQRRKAGTIVEKFNSAPDELIVARDLDGNILGFATFNINEEVGLGEIGNNAVYPQYQGAGIGKLLYKHVIEIFKARGLVYATVTTGYEDSGHAKARAAYEKVGFKKMRTSITYSMKL